MLPRPVLPRILDPRYVAIESPTDLPLCWLGVPFSLNRMEDYAKAHDFVIPETYRLQPLPNSVDIVKTWGNVAEYLFEEEHGVHLELKEAWGGLSLLSSRTGKLMRSR